MVNNNNEEAGAEAAASRSGRFRDWKAVSMPWRLEARELRAAIEQAMRTVDSAALHMRASKALGVGEAVPAPVLHVHRVVLGVVRHRVPQEENAPSMQEIAAAWDARGRQFGFGRDAAEALRAQPVSDHDIPGVAVDAAAERSLLLVAVAEAHRAAGWAVMACARHGVTALRLGLQLGAPAFTVDALLRRANQGTLELGHLTLIVIDEASNLGLWREVELAGLRHRYGLRMLTVGHIK